ncbi:MAG: hypothetical protein EP348_01875 [Alphaproteobacteria bacterium]|nr:MAG: hypothetical protein EP348_01875 [Alphaproteobacteria bacterium]
MFQTDPDTYEIESAAQAALSLNPKDPMARVFHFMIGTARWMRDLETLRPGVPEPLDAACASVQVDYFPLMTASIKHELEILVEIGLPRE